MIFLRALSLLAGATLSSKSYIKASDGEPKDFASIRSLEAGTASYSRVELYSNGLESD